MTIDDASRSSRRAVRACGGVLSPCVLAAALAGSGAAALAGGGSSPCDAGPTWWEVDRIGEDDTLTSQNPGNGLSTLGGGPCLYHTHTAHWTQTVDAKAVEARFIVYGTQSPSDNWDPFYTWEQSFKHFHYSVFIMEGNFEDFASQSFPIPSNPPGDIVYINFGLGTEGGGPTDIEKRDEVFGCVGINCTHPTFDYRFDLSDHDIILEEGKEYVMWLRTLGQPSVGHVRLAYSSVSDVIDFGSYCNGIHQPPAWLPDYDPPASSSAFGIGLLVEGVGSEPANPADLNCDGAVNVADLLILFDSWGDCADPEDCPADLNGDGVVNVADLLILFDNWG